MIAAPRRKNRLHKNAKSRFQLEALEDRTLLSGLTPATVVGHQFTMTIGSGSGVYPSSGTFVLGVSSSALNYYELGTTPGFTDVFGTYTYTQSSATNATLALQDAAMPGVPANDALLYTTATAGIYTTTSISGTQSGSFTQTPAPAGPSPASVAGEVMQFTVTAGHGQLAASGNYSVTTDATGTGYELSGAPGVLTGDGNFAYNKTTATTATITATDSGGHVITEDMTYTSATGGTFVVVDAAHDYWQMGTFTQTPQLNVLPTGSFDSATQATLTGWVYDGNSKSGPASIQVDVDGVAIATVAGTGFRGDLQTYLGSPLHGFTYNLPISLAFGPHTATVYAVDSTTSALVSLGSRSFYTQPAMFDEAWYDANNPDVALAIAQGRIASGWIHYLNYGQQEGRDPSAYFNENYYRAANPDVLAAIQSGALQSGFEHFIRFGQAEAGRNPTPYFIEQYYLSNNPDVAAAVNSGAFTSGYQHFLLYGSLENRVPSTEFNPTIYLQKNPDVAAAVNNHTIRSAWDHWMLYGRFEGRAAV